MHNFDFLDQICSEFIANEHVELGKMMQKTALPFRKKVFAFFWNEAMIFKLGKDSPLESLGINEYEYLNPFKHTPLMKAWFVIQDNYRERWAERCEIALD